MVWRGNIKILEAKVLPLIISALMHTVILLCLSAVDYNSRYNKGERVFTVELMFQNSGYNLKSRNPSPTMHVDKLLPHEVEKKALPSHERDTSSAHNRESLFAKPDNSLHDSDSMDKGYEGVALISDNPSGGVREPLTSSSYERGGIGTDRDFRKAIVEGEFGSINGPSFLKMVKPAYPWLARRFDKEGKVTLSLFIDEHGRLIDVEIIERAGYGFDEAAIDAVKASTFRPARLNGIPVACKAVLPVRFKLE